MTACATSADVIVTGDVSPGPNDYTIGATSEGSITVNNGSVVSDWNVLQIGAGALGTVTATDPGTSITAVRFDLGTGSEGRFDLLNGASGNVGSIRAGMDANGFGSMNVNSATLTASSQSVFGHVGSGTLEIQNGGSFHSTSNVILGLNGHGQGLLRGQNSTLTTTLDLKVGTASTGDLKISEQAEAHSYNGIIASHGGSTGSVTVTGVGSKWTVDRFLQVGSFGNGSLTVERGGIVSVFVNAVVPAYQGATGNLLLQGEGSLLKTHDLYVGDVGTGWLTVEDYADLQTRDIHLRNVPQAIFTNQCRVEARTLYLRSAANLRITNGAMVKLSGGINLDGSLIFDSGLLDLNGQSFNGSDYPDTSFTWSGGTLSNVGRVTTYRPMLQQGGTFQIGPAHGPGHTILKTNYELQSHGTLEIDLAGSSPLEIDQLSVYFSKIGTFAGRLELNVLNSYVPGYGVMHKIIYEDGGEISGTFASISGVEFAPDRYLAVVYDEDSINVIAALPGDANLDNTIDFNDLLAVAQNYQSGNISTWVQGDFNGSGSVDFNDLLLVAQHYGTALSLSGDLTADSIMVGQFETDWHSALASVPEPSVAMVLGAMSLLALRRRAK